MTTDFFLQSKWIDELKQQPACSPFLVDFLDYIRKSMMVVDKAERSMIQQVTEWLRSRSETCLTEKTYALRISQFQDPAKNQPVKNQPAKNNPAKNHENQTRATYVSQVLPLNYFDESILQEELNRLLGFDGWSGRMEVRIVPSEFDQSPD